MIRVNLKKISTETKSNNPFLQKVSYSLVPYRAKVFNHEIYSTIKTQEETQIFMANHVFAVWDFMSLLKTLQNHLSCVKIPWIPKPNTELCHFINEIVMGEECDDLGTLDASKATDHYSLYLKGMSEIKANSKPAEHFINSQLNGIHWRKALKDTEEKFASGDTRVISKGTLEFVQKTLTICENAPIHIIASSFLFGREDPIPKMFQRIIDTLDAKAIVCPNFRVYLARHVEVDGGRHSVLAEKMIISICGDDKQKWDEVEENAKKSLDDRFKLWDSIMEQINIYRKKAL